MLSLLKSWASNLNAMLAGRWLGYFRQAWQCDEALVVRPEAPEALEHDLPPAKPPLTQVDAVNLVAPTPNRSQRRHYERLRRKHDKFLKKRARPQPAHDERPSAPKPRPKPVKEQPALTGPVGLAIKTQEQIIVDKLVDSSEDVLFEESEFYGEFNFRDTILDQLDRYFVYLARIKKADPDAYNLYRQVGATILPHAATFTTARRADLSDEEYLDDERGPFPMNPSPVLAPWFLQKRPAFGCFSYGADTATERYEAAKTAAHARANNNSPRRCYVPRFMYFQKYESPPSEIQPVHGGDVYIMTIYWDDEKLAGGAAQDYPIFVGADGRLAALKVLETVTVRLPRSKRPQNREYVNRTFKSRQWTIPDHMRTWAHSLGVDPYLLTVDIFAMAVNRWELSNYSMCRVAVRKGDMVAQFSLNPRRMSYFFQDRNETVSQTGQRRRIFHVVKPHIRVDGAAVPMHFRGERQFRWGDYDVEITVPGMDHFVAGEFDLGVIDSEYRVDGVRYAGSEKVGKMLADMMRTESKR